MGSAQRWSNFCPHGYILLIIFPDNREQRGNFSATKHTFPLYVCGMGGAQKHKVLTLTAPHEETDPHHNVPLRHKKENTIKYPYFHVA